MNKKSIYGVVAALVLLTAIIGFLVYRMYEQRRESNQMLELAEMDKLEMENEYEEFARQYSEMKTQINNDSLVAQLEQEQQRTEELLAELKRVKSNDAAEIMRLKKELATLRKVLRSYVLQIDSLNRMNAELTQENTNLKTQNRQAQAHINSLSSENETLSSKVEIASQLDATGIRAEGRNKRGKAAKKIKDVKKFVISFTVARNVTTSTEGIKQKLDYTHPNAGNIGATSLPQPVYAASTCALLHLQATSCQRAELSSSRTAIWSTVFARISNTQARSRAYRFIGT